MPKSRVHPRVVFTEWEQIRQIQEITRNSERVRARQVLGTVKPSTLNSYRSEIMFIARMFNTSGDFYTKSRLFCKSHSTELFEHVGKHLSVHYFLLCLEFREVLRMKNLPKFRSAVSLALRAAGQQDWARSDELIGITAAAEKRILDVKSTRYVPGSINESRLMALLPVIVHPNPRKKRFTESLKLAIEIQQKGAFRIGELIALTPSCIRQDGVILHDSKAVRATSITDEAPIKYLHKWPSGARALELLQQKAEDTLRTGFEESLLFPANEWTVDELNKAIQQGAATLDWESSLHWKSHSLRHGGVSDCVKQKKNWSIGTLSRYLLMSVEMIEYYGRSNNARLEQVARLQSKKKGR